MKKLYSKIDDGLYSGSYQALLNQWKQIVGYGVRALVSVVPIGRVGHFMADNEYIDPRPVVHKVLFCWDDQPVDPETIEHAVNTPLPTFIHCNAGENRSTCMAACWLMRQGRVGGAAAALDVAEAARTETLGRPPKMYSEMKQNVHRYEKWLIERGLM